MRQIVAGRSEQTTILPHETSSMTEIPLLGSPLSCLNGAKIAHYRAFAIKTFQLREPIQ
jgi:hypothetical protein